MTFSRLPFAIEDLEWEIRQLVTSGARIALMLDGATFSAVIGELRHHGKTPLSPIAGTGDSTAMYQYGGVSIVRA